MSPSLKEEIIEIIKTGNRVRSSITTASDVADQVFSRLKSQIKQMENPHKYKITGSSSRYADENAYEEAKQNILDKLLGVK